MKIRPFVFLIWFFLIAHPPVYSQDHPELPAVLGGIVWSPDDTILAVGTTHGIQFHQTTDLALIPDVMETPNNITAFDWSSDGKLIALGSSVERQGQLEIWEVQSQIQLFSFVLHSSPISAIHFSPDDSMIVSVDWSSTIIFMDVSTGTILSQTQIGSSQSNHSASWNPEGNAVVVQHLTGIYYVKPNGQIRHFITGKSWSIDQVTWSPDGHYLAGARLETAPDGTLYIWDAQTGAEIVVDPLEGGIHSLAWHPSSKLIAYGLLKFTGDEHTSHLIIMQIDNQKFLADFEGIYVASQGSPENSLAWSHDGSHLAVATDDGKIYVWDTVSFEQIAVYEGYRSLISTD